MPAARARSTLARAPAHTLASTARRPLPCSRAGGNANNRARDGRRPDDGDPAQLEGRPRLPGRGAPGRLTRWVGGTDRDAGAGDTMKWGRVGTTPPPPR